MDFRFSPPAFFLHYSFLTNIATCLHSAQSLKCVFSIQYSAIRQSIFYRKRVIMLCEKNQLQQFLSLPPPLFLFLRRVVFSSPLSVFYQRFCCSFYGCEFASEVFFFLKTVVFSSKSFWRNLLFLFSLKIYWPVFEIFRVLRICL